MFFEVLKKSKDSHARLGLINTPHGKIETPEFIPVGTQASVKSMTPRELEEIGAQIILANTYHLYLRPGTKVIKKFNGLHKFMGWNGPIITDSGGFQVFSLGYALEHGVGKIASIFPDDIEGGRVPSKRQKPRLTKIDENGVTFTSHLDGSTHRLTPEKSIEIQHDLGADIILAFDECTSPLSDYNYTKEALFRTHRWAMRCIDAMRKQKISRHKKFRQAPYSSRGDYTGQAIFGIVQGGHYQDLRIESAEFISSMPFDGIAIGGSLGKSKSNMHDILEWIVPILPENKPRHLLGIGGIPDFFECVERGIDTFDCVIPTREARNGALLTRTGRLNILKSSFKFDRKPIDKDCGCFTCRNFARAYLHHLFKSKEMLGPRLATYHNLYFVLNLLKMIRKSIRNNNFKEFKKYFLSHYI